MTNGNGLSCSISGPKLPEKRVGLKLIRLGSGDVIAIGGFDGSKNRDTLFRLRCTNRTCQWSEMAQKLNKPKSGFVAIPVPTSMTNCN